ncbi:MAG: NAD(P)-binding protein, partial [Akkermansiaceae bacterium]|nr:NAD(P)-binding protein [Akkermansiaceae bacterium]
MSSPRSRGASLSAARDAERVVVIGAGPGGLASALLLAANGVEVDVFERRSVVGGRTSTLEVEGFHFDLGPTFFLYPRVLEEIFAAAGARLSEEVELVRLDPQYRLLFEDGPQIDATPDLERMEEEVARISPEDARHLGRFMTENLAKLERLSPILQRPFEGWRDLLDPELFRGGPPPVRPWLSIDNYLKRFFKDPRVRLAFSFQSKYLGMSPYRCPELFSILSGI